MLWAASAPNLRARGRGWRQLGILHFVQNDKEDCAQQTKNARKSPAIQAGLS